MPAAKPAKRSADHALARLSELREAGSLPGADAEVIGLIGHASGHVATRAIKLAVEWKLERAVPEFEKAFERFLTNPLESDKGCSAKLAVVEALCAFEAHRPTVYWRGIRYRQMEPVWGKSEDTAAALRAACGRGLALLGHERVHLALAELLMDPERVAREGAVSVLSWLATPEAELVLHMKILAGDAEPLVLGECFRALMTNWPADAFERVASYLHRADPYLVEQAALALGESKHESALQRLEGAYEHARSDVKRALLLPIALIRSEEAFAFVLGVLESGPEPSAFAALTALELFESDEKRTALIRKAATSRAGKIGRAYEAAHAEGRT